MRFSADRAQQLDAIHRSHVPIGNDQVERTFLDQVERRFAIARLGHVDDVDAFQKAAQNAQHVVVVVDDKGARRFIHRKARIQLQEKGEA